MVNSHNNALLGQVSANEASQTSTESMFQACFGRSSIIVTSTNRG